MTTLRETLLAGVQSLLADAVGEGINVIRAPHITRNQSVSPVVAVSPLTDELDPGQRGSYLTHRLQFQVSVYARGEIADQAADAICEIIHAALMADESLDGAAMRTSPLGTSWLFDEDDVNNVRVDMIFEAIYSSRRGSLSTRP